MSLKHFLDLIIAIHVTCGITLAHTSYIDVVINGTNFICQGPNLENFMIISEAEIILICVRGYNSVLMKLGK